MASSLEPVERKLCPGCNVYMPLFNFHRKANSQAGRASKCRFCMAETAAIRRADPEKYRADKLARQRAKGKTAIDRVRKLLNDHVFKGMGREDGPQGNGSFR